MTESKLVKSMAKILKKSSISKKFRKIIEFNSFCITVGYFRYNMYRSKWLAIGALIY